MCSGAESPNFPEKQNCVFLGAVSGATNALHPEPNTQGSFPASSFKTFCSLCERKNGIFYDKKWNIAEVII